MKPSGRKAWPVAEEKGVQGEATRRKLQLASVDMAAT